MKKILYGLLVVVIVIQQSFLVNAAQGKVEKFSADENNEVMLATAAGEWIQAADGRWWYRHNDGSYTTSGWEYINGAWYYFDSQGWMMTGWINGAGQLRQLL